MSQDIIYTESEEGDKLTFKFTRWTHVAPCVNCKTITNKIEIISKKSICGLGCYIRYENQG